MEPFRRHLTSEVDVPEGISQTDFEKHRGLHGVEIRERYANVFVPLSMSDSKAKLKALGAIRKAQISIDFLKLAGGGISFVCTLSNADSIEQCLKDAGFKPKIIRDRCVLIAYGANMRDQEGLIAKIVSILAAGTDEIDHLGDMHDRVLAVVPKDQAQELAQTLNRLLTEHVPKGELHKDEEDSDED